tara:strand:+ start:677 stop:1333 length:657 start_codon:yes stop_codon:yes gene_type:complete
MKLPKKPLKKTFLKQKKLLPWFKTDEQDLDKIMAREIDFKSATKKQMRDALVTLEQTIKAQQRTIYNACEEGRWQRNYLRILIIEAKGYAKKFNKDFEKQEAKHDALVFILRDKIEKLENGAHVKKYIDAYDDCIKKNDDFVIANNKLVKERNEICRAYNGLHQMGKFAEDEGIDIKKYSKKLPENNMEFEQEHKVLESGKVQHSYKFTMPKKQKKKN